MGTPAKFAPQDITPISDVPAKFDTSQIQPLDSATTAPAGPKSLLDRYEAAVEPFTRIEKPDSNDKWNPKEAVKAVGNIGAGGLGMILHPINTLEGIGGMITAPGEMIAGKPFKETIPGQMIQSFRENPLGTAEAAVGASAVGKAVPLESTPSTKTTVPRVLRPLIEKTQEARKAATEAADEYQNTLRSNTEDIAKKQTAASKAAKAEQIANDRTHQTQVAETKAANDAAMKQQSKIAPTQGKLENSVQEMQAQVETARNNALKEGNNKYSAVNETLNQVPADPSAIKDAVHDSLSKITGTYSEPSIIKSVASRLENGDNLSYEDLQGYYTELGRELSKGSLPSDLYQAYDTIQEAIGSDMQRIADANGKGAQLTDARNYWRRMKQAFGKPYNPTDAGNVVLDKTAGGVMRKAEQDNRLRLLGSFDKTIPQTAEHIDNLQKGIESLPKEQPIRNILKPLPEKPAPVPAPKFEGTPEELAKQKTPLPKASGKTVIDQADIEDARRGRLQNDADLMRTKGTFGATVMSLYALRSLVHGQFGPLGSVPIDVGVAVAATRGLANLMERPSVVNFFSKATAKDIAAIPPELRGDLPKLVQVAQKRGVPVSAALAAIAGGTQQKPVAAALQPVQ